MRSPFCMPRRMKGSRWTKKTDRVTPMSLLDRFREAVFRLIMLSALSKAAAHETKYSDSTAQNQKEKEKARNNYCYTNAYEPHHSEAVADCIEFIKRSAISDTDNRSSTGSCSIDDDAVRPDLPPAGSVIYQGIH